MKPPIFIFRPVVIVLLLAGLAIVIAMAFRMSEKRIPPAIVIDGTAAADIPVQSFPMEAAQEEQAIALIPPTQPELEYPEDVEFMGPQSFSLPTVAADRKSGEAPAWIKNAVAAPPLPDGWARVVIIIDDMAVDYRRSLRVLEIPAPLTLSFLPYARGVKDMAGKARALGHELMVHVPMQPMDDVIDPGPNVLRAGMDTAAAVQALNVNLDVFDGYVGFNNHMGSRATQDAAVMRAVMAEAKNRGLSFVDSRTIEASVAASAAAAAGIPYEIRDVFLDHQEDIESVRKALSRLEEIAHKHGHAIAIGHPKDHTIDVLRGWIPTLAEKKLVLSPISTVLIQPGEAPSPPPE